MLRIFMIVLLMHSGLQAAEINWYKSYAEAQKVAKTAKKPMLVYMYSDCAACKYIDSKVFPDDKVADYITQHFIPLSLSPKNDAPKALQVVVAPVIHYVKSDGELIQDDTIGATTVSTLLHDMASAVHSID